MAIKPELLTELFVKAEGQELGLVIETNNPRLLEVALHDHRKIAGLWPDIMVLTPSAPNTIMLCHRSVELDP